MCARATTQHGGKSTSPTSNVHVVCVVLHMYMHTKNDVHYSRELHLGNSTRMVCEGLQRLHRPRLYHHHHALTAVGDQTVEPPGQQQAKRRGVRVRRKGEASYRFNQLIGNIPVEGSLVMRVRESRHDLSTEDPHLARGCPSLERFARSSILPFLTDN